MVDGDRGILVLKGAIPGPKGGLVTVETSVKAAK
jgi:large subunit ribosomal protein L3